MLTAVSFFRWPRPVSAIGLLLISILLSPASAADTPLFRAISAVAKRHHPQALVLPTMLAGFTNSRYLREKGMVSYGFSGITLQAGENYGVHGPNERVPLASLGRAAQILFEVLQELDADAGETAG